MLSLQDSLCRVAQEGCEEEVGASLSPDGKVLRNVAVLLSGHRVREAAALATSTGNPRLASLILQVPPSTLLSLPCNAVGFRSSGHSCRSALRL